MYQFDLFVVVVAAVVDHMPQLLLPLVLVFVVVVVLFCVFILIVSDLKAVLLSFDKLP